MTAPSLTRLHISPLTPDLLSVALGAKVSGIAQNISYQSIPTFPENDYGFLDLPPADAKRLISKLNGAILKGRKMKVEEARPAKRQRAHSDENDKEVGKSRESRRKEKKEPNTLEGYALPETRKVKRGWTEPKVERSKRQKADKGKSAKSQAPSKYTDKEELLFHTALPPGKADLGNGKKNKNAKKSKSNHTVHEFEKTFTQPSFLRDPTSTAEPATHFIDGKGWVNEQDEIVEEEPPNLKRKRAKKAEGLKIDVAKAQQPRQSTKKLEPKPTGKSEASQEQSDESSASSGDDDDDDGDTSSSGITTDDDVQGKSTERNAQTAGLGLMEVPDTQDVPEINIQPALETPSKIHPLEALFKKPARRHGQESAKPSLEVETAFTFFGADMQEVDEDEDDKLPPMPVTPFTSQDLNSRGVRSAAPTPDTAHPSRFAGYAAAFESRLGAALNERDETKGSEFRVSNTSEDSVEPEHETEFQKRFWAERAQNNRAWKNQRRTAVKEERHRENRSRRTKNR